MVHLQENVVVFVNRFNNCALLTVIAVFIAGMTVTAQNINRAKFRDSIRQTPYFSIHKDNYFISGVPTNKTIGRATADAKYQISFRQVVTREKLPLDAYIYLTYTQKSFWNIYEDSFPFRDVNFNPSVAIAKPIFSKTDRLKGLLSLSVEHESNGRDSIFSRSWNRVTFGYATKLWHKTSVHFEAWIPFAYQKGNPDILDYTGLAEINLEQEFIKNKFYASVMLRKGINLDGKGTVRSRIYYSLFKKNTANQYLMLEWYVGQAENLLLYQQSRSVIRIGYVIKTNEFNFFK